VQEEAPPPGKPVLVTRDVTERTEAVAEGTVELVGTSPTRIIEATERLLDDDATYLAMSRRHNPYGDGRASERIVTELLGVRRKHLSPWHVLNSREPPNGSKLGDDSAAP
jgi:UDP-N-acetylglucosamine 2-epimerase